MRDNMDLKNKLTVEEARALLKKVVTYTGAYLSDDAINENITNWQFEGIIYKTPQEKTDEYINKMQRAQICVGHDWETLRNFITAERAKRKEG